MSIPGGESRVINQQILMLRRGIKGDLRHFKLDERRRGACVSERGLKVDEWAVYLQIAIPSVWRRKMRKVTLFLRGAHLSCCPLVLEQQASQCEQQPTCLHHFEGPTHNNRLLLFHRRGCASQHSTATEASPL